MNDVISHLATLFSAAMSSRINKFYEHEVKIAVKNYLPILMIIPNSTTVIDADTCRDRFEYNVTVRIVANIMSYVDEDGTGTVIKSSQGLVNMIEQRNADGTLMDDTVLGVLRTNLRTNYWLHSTGVVANYAAIETGEFPYAKAEVQVSQQTDWITRPS